MTTYRDAKEICLDVSGVCNAYAMVFCTPFQLLKDKDATPTEVEYFNTIMQRIHNIRFVSSDEIETIIQFVKSMQRKPGVEVGRWILEKCIRGLDEQPSQRVCDVWSLLDGGSWFWSSFPKQKHASEILWRLNLEVVIQRRNENDRDLFLDLFPPNLIVNQWCKDGRFDLFFLCLEWYNYRDLMEIQCAFFVQCMQMGVATQTIPLTTLVQVVRRIFQLEAFQEHCWVLLCVICEKLSAPTQPVYEEVNIEALKCLFLRLRQTNIDDAIASETVALVNSCYCISWTMLRPYPTWFSLTIEEKEAFQDSIARFWEENQRKFVTFHGNNLFAILSVM